jgi:FkbM family methyltransferase
MIPRFNELIKKHRLHIKGILHIGGHYGQEMALYEKENIKNVVFFEPVSKNFKVLAEKIGNKALLINTALGSHVGKASMFVETVNNGQSSSVLEPHIHLKDYPNIVFEEKEEVEMNTLDNFLKERSDVNIDNYNMINIDVQGYELEVFKGAKEALTKIDYIKSEINKDEVYKNCAKVWELDAFLKPYGFKRVETDFDGGSWGDAFYIKRKPIKLFGVKVWPWG